MRKWCETDSQWERCIHRQPDGGREKGIEREIKTERERQIDRKRERQREADGEREGKEVGGQQRPSENKSGPTGDKGREQSYTQRQSEATTGRQRSTVVGGGCTHTHLDRSACKPP